MASMWRSGAECEQGHIAGSHSQHRCLCRGRLFGHADQERPHQAHAPEGFHQRQSWWPHRHQAQGKTLFSCLSGVLEWTSALSLQLPEQCARVCFDRGILLRAHASPTCWIASLACIVACACQCYTSLCMQCLYEAVCTALGWVAEELQMRLQPGDKLIWVDKCTVSDSLLLANSEGRAIRFCADDTQVKNPPIFII